MKIVSILVFVVCVATKVDSKSGCDPNSQVTEAFATGANDVVVVRQPDGSLAATPVHLQIGKFTNWYTLFKSRKRRPVAVVINGRNIELDRKFTISRGGAVCFDNLNSNNLDEAITLNPNELNRMELRAGQNDGLFVVESLHLEVPFSIFLLDQSARLVITDIDGTITESDVKGFVFPQFGLEAHQDSVIELFQKIANNNYTIIYLTARSMANDADTRKYLFQDLQNKKGFSLPMSPLFMSPMPLSDAAYEGLTNPSQTKAATLFHITQLFEKKKDVIYGAYGNAETDVEAYLRAGIHPELIYLVNEEGKLRSLNNGLYVTTYGAQAQQVDSLYPR